MMRLQHTGEQSIRSHLLVKGAKLNRSRRTPYDNTLAALALRHFDSLTPQARYEIFKLCLWRDSENPFIKHFIDLELYGSKYQLAEHQRRLDIKSLSTFKSLFTVFTLRSKYHDATKALDFISLGKKAKLAVQLRNLTWKTHLVSQLEEQLLERLVDHHHRRPFFSWNRSMIRWILQQDNQMLGSFLVNDFLWRAELYDFQNVQMHQMIADLVRKRDQNDPQTIGLRIVYFRRFKEWIATKESITSLDETLLILSYHALSGDNSHDKKISLQFHTLEPKQCYSFLKRIKNWFPQDNDFKSLFENIGFKLPEVPLTLLLRSINLLIKLQPQNPPVQLIEKTLASIDEFDYDEIYFDELRDILQFAVHLQHYSQDQAKHLLDTMLQIFLDKHTFLEPSQFVILMNIIVEVGQEYIDSHKIFAEIRPYYSQNILHFPIQFHATMKQHTKFEL